MSGGSISDSQQGLLNVKDNPGGKIITHVSPENINSEVTGIRAFDGKLYVASTQPEISLWNRAGWQISDQSLDSNKNEIPFDCTLYPHQGVKGQWIGGCTGHIIIPVNGAGNIAVLFTNEDGQAIGIQVAPLPAYP